MGWGWGGMVGCGLHSHIHVQPNYSDEVVLLCVVVGIVKTRLLIIVLLNCSLIMRPCQI